jgi:hypothetical protein
MKCSMTSNTTLSFAHSFLKVSVLNVLLLLCSLLTHYTEYCRLPLDVNLHGCTIPGTSNRIADTIDNQRYDNMWQEHDKYITILEHTHTLRISKAGYILGPVPMG